MAFVEDRNRALINLVDILVHIEECKIGAIAPGRIRCKPLAACGISNDITELITIHRLHPPPVDRRLPPPQDGSTCVVQEAHES